MPEEINRVLTDHVSTILLCPTRQAVRNVQAEGFALSGLDEGLLPFDRGDPLSLPSCSADEPLVLNVGDVMLDVYLASAAQAETASTISQCLDLKSADYALATLHRAENTDDPERLCGILEGLRSLAEDGMRVVFPIHPRTREALSCLDISIDGCGIDIIEPMGYLDMLALERNAKIILTDSGGVQKEAYFSHVPCITLRDETEWVELVEGGWNQLAGADPVRIHDAIQRALALDRADQNVLLYGDGHASERIVWVLEQWWRRAQA
jgi:UDP-N-acetylglucosamine 2-epimerase